MYALGQRYPLAFYMAEGFLHLTEQTSGAGQGERHRTQLAKHPVPLVDANPPLGAGDGGQDRMKTLHTVGRQGDCHVDGVNNPP